MMTNYKIKMDYAQSRYRGRWPERHFQRLPTSGLNYVDTHNGDAYLIEFEKEPYNFSKAAETWGEKRTRLSNQHMSIWPLNWVWGMSSS